MTRRKISLVSLFLLLLMTVPALAATQDFQLVNDTGVEIYRIYVSESGNDDWEEDVLGDDVLPQGDRLEMNFRGRNACLWDIRVEDEDGEALEWNGINLCETSVVILRCDSEECWAEYE